MQSTVFVGAYLTARRRYAVLAPFSSNRATIQHFYTLPMLPRSTHVPSISGVDGV